MYVAGLTESGKTTFIIEQLGIAKRKGLPTMACTAKPSDVPRYQRVCKFVTMDMKIFMKVALSPRTFGAVLGVDEVADEEIGGRYDQGGSKKLATQYADRGSCIFGVQRAVDMHKTVRTQCRFVVAFAQFPSDAKLLAIEYNAPELLESANLKQFQYIKAERYGEVGYGSIKPHF